jgi:hypothetical protein
MDSDDFRVVEVVAKDDDLAPGTEKVKGPEIRADRECPETFCLGANLGRETRRRIGQESRNDLLGQRRPRPIIDSPRVCHGTSGAPIRHARGTRVDVSCLEMVAAGR